MWPSSPKRLKRKKNLKNHKKTMFKKVKNLLKKKTSPPVEEKTTKEKSPQKAEAGASPTEATLPATSESIESQEKPGDQHSASDIPGKESSVKSEDTATSLSKPEESKEQKVAPSQDGPPAVKPIEESVTTSSKVEESEKTKSDTTKKREDTASQPKEDSVVTSDSDSSKEPSSESSPSDDSKQDKTEVSQASVKPEEPGRDTIKLQGLFAFKMSMTSLYDEQGRVVPVTALKYKPWVVSQIKTKEKEGYSAAQLACMPQKNKRSSLAQIKHLAPAGFKEGARYIREIRQELPENIKVGLELSIESLKKGDRVRISSRSKGRGYAGVVKRWGFRGGPASHGSKIHRSTGSIGQCTEPSRVMPGRKMPGQYGFETITLNSVPVVDVLPKEGVIFVKGPVSGARNTLVSLKKVEEARV